ncbi:hypothetical protein A3Q56_06965 [Intoshia linei]|uniref:Uncharacterized protein n=1 Tax=Intoshia linei TaxID=1819745 RepID=A0A177AVU6_9BILA|nr:hypothetical protein A3Q56_06965 [Intoshia linei]
MTELDCWHIDTLLRATQTVMQEIVTPYRNVSKICDVMFINEGLRVNSYIPNLGNIHLTTADECFYKQESTITYNQLETLDLDEDGLDRHKGARGEIPKEQVELVTCKEIKKEEKKLFQVSKISKK